ncbi:hypothetical protein CHLNCDRAFT_141951 [Chlorella variabilis]|uniref:S5 DRBM domain-containing protein n=1 Tax=Chlorella variabilis TaxID=554065 RepID=E1Z7E1_CHLVA|nr:hypothetical protein CHLNCDRAFT_141951 [Chlorella variabilis]EFN58153.1 hypothetical protein CHLNCDRAFT_141951 [Chlorella variabilis]|eukprot:XP_005850255.1 hypothetical protein CHLNCDRAFT_141951 [Chlorella variabilis]
MRALMLLRAARAAAAAVEPFGSLRLASEACGTSAAPLVPVSQLTSLLGMQFQQQAAYAARHRGDDSDEDDEAAATGRHSKLTHSQRKLLIDRKLREGEEREPVSEEEDDEDRVRRIMETLGNLGHPTNDNASSFVSSFFGQRRRAAASSSGEESDEDLRYRGEGGRFAPPRHPLAAAAADGDLAVDGEAEDELSEAEEADEDALEVSLPGALEEEEEVDLLSKLHGLRPGSRRIMLQQLLEGGIMRVDPQARAEWEAIQEQFKPPADFRMKVVDVNRTCKGTRTGGLYRYSCMVVVGNGNGVLGWGQGKAAEVNDAVQKAYQRACRNLYPIPRYNDHTIPEPMNAKYGQVRVTMYPKASGNGIKANALMYEICKMAGLYDIGIKVHGSRNVRNAVKCVFKAFDQIRTEEDFADEAQAAGKLVAKMPPGRYRNLRI